MLKRKPTIMHTALLLVLATTMQASSHGHEHVAPAVGPEPPEAAEKASRSITESYRARMNRESLSTIGSLEAMQAYSAETDKLLAQQATEVLRQYRDPPNIDSALMVALLRGSAIDYAGDSQAYIARSLEVMTGDASGAEIAIRLIGMGQSLEDAQMAAVFDHLTTNSAAPELLAGEPDLWREFNTVRFSVSAKYAAKHHSRLAALGARLPEDLDFGGFLGAQWLYEWLRKAAPGRGPERVPFRDALIAQIQEHERGLHRGMDFYRILSLEGGSPEGYLTDRLTFLQGPAGLGQLEGARAPELDFAWTSAGFEAHKLSELRDQIVVLDFWATWCGPCIASFPTMRHIVETFQGQPITFIGVTSVQGAHVQGGESIKCASVQEEYDLMPPLMAELDMTWPVAFTAQAVYNPEYGISGIPHMTIVDARGRVVRNNLHPWRDEETIIEILHGLLEQHDGGS